MFRRAEALVFAAAAACFAASLRGGFVWDDWEYVVRPAAERGFSPAGLLSIFSTFHTAHYTPLAQLSLALDDALWGLARPWGYHAVNVLLHALTAALFFRIALKLLRGSVAGAAVAALAFAVHPLRAESVAWVCERREVLSGALFMATILLHLDGRRRASIACFAAAALSKPSVVPLPLVLPLLDWARGAIKGKAAWRAALFSMAPYFAIAIGEGLLTLHGSYAAANLTGLAERGLRERLAQAVGGLGFYLHKTAWPSALSPFYPSRDGSWSASLPLAAAAIVVVESAMARLGAPRRVRIAAWAYYVLMLLPVSGLIQNGVQSVAARYSYLACLGWALLLGALAASRGKAVRAALAAWLVCLPILTQAEIRMWKSDLSLWDRAVNLFPSSADVHLLRAYALTREDSLEESLAEARVAWFLARDRRPVEREAVAHVADTLTRLDRLPEARAVLETYLARDPDWKPGRYYLSLLDKFEAKSSKSNKSGK